MPKSLFLNLLAHEMVHQHQYETTGLADHGRTFQSWVPRLALVGLNLQEAYAS